MNVDVTRGLIGRRGCGSTELVFGVLLVLDNIQTFNVMSLLCAMLTILTGALGIVSNKRPLVISYMVAGIICVVLLSLAIISGVVDIVVYNDDSTTQAILVADVVSVAVGLLLAVLGVIFACLPLCGYSEGQGAEQYQHRTPTAPSYNQGNTAYPFPV